MMRFRIDRAVFVVLLLYTASQDAVATTPVKGRPNIVFILADDWGWGDLGCYGHRQLRTPNLDGLAKQGIRFTQFYSCASVCSPSRTAFLTGRYPARYGIHGHFADAERNVERGMPNYLDPSAPSIARLLHQAGYATAHFGKWHLGHSPDAPSPKAYGFDEFFSILSTPGDPDFRKPGYWPRSSERFIDKTIDFIERHKNGPFYVQTWLLDVHARLQPTAEQLTAYPHLLGATKIYYAAATNADKQIGRLLAKLDELGLHDNTIVLFTSDNGPEDIYINEASEHGVGSTGPFRGRKRSLYEGGIRMPMIVRWPNGTPNGGVDDTTLMAAVDFLPTLCAAAGVDVPAATEPDGENLLAAWRGQPVERTKPLFWEWRFRIFGHVINKSPILAMRSGDFKLLMNPDRSRIELYDIPRDPTELNNLASAKPDLVEKMSTEALAWQKTLPEGPLDESAGTNTYPCPKPYR